MTKRASLPMVGIIAEDKSDVEAIRTLLRRMTRPDIDTKSFAASGCGRIHRKCRSWAVQLKIKGCSVLILVHDLDRREPGELRCELQDALKPSPIATHLICIPKEEIEAWWLADPEAIARVLGMKKAPSVKGHPETIPSPKEHLGALVHRATGNRRVFMHTAHNAKIAAEVDFRRVRGCQSFNALFEFVQSHVMPSERP